MMEDTNNLNIYNDKRHLINPSEENFNILIEEFKTKLKECQGEFFYQLGKGENQPTGLKKDEIENSYETLTKILSVINSEITELRQTNGEEGQIVDYIVRKCPGENDFMDVRVAVVGNVDAGKSTLLGVLTHGDYDNGRGSARMKLFRHKHEMESGRTSSVGNDILGFNVRGEVVNNPVHGQLDWVKICEEAAKVVTFIDLAGHEKYLKTTVFGMTGHAPDFAMLMIGANAGIIGMTKEHLGLALALNVPVFVVVTKIDMCPPNIMKETMALLTRVLKSPGCRKMPIVVRNEDDVICSALNFQTERMCPVFCVSNVTGENLPLLKKFLNLLIPQSNPCISDPAEFQIDDIFQVQGVGTVVSGTCLKGQIKLNDSLLLGPDPLGNFVPHVVKGIHRKRMPVREVSGSQTASFALKKIKKDQIRKGMVMISPNLKPRASFEFSADLLILHHPSTISVKYQAMVHVGPIRQTATIIGMSQSHLTTGDRAEVRFRFIKNPEFIRPGLRLVFREGKTKAVGTVTQVYPDAPKPLVNTRIHHRNHHHNNHHNHQPLSTPSASASASATLNTNKINISN